jgi:hypothetical protein
MPPRCCKRNLEVPPIAEEEGREVLNGLLRSGANDKWADPDPMRVEDDGGAERALEMLPETKMEELLIL